MSVDTAALRPFWLAIGATIAVLVGGGLLLAGASSFTRSISDDVVDRPDLAFAAGFVALFGPLVLFTLPLIVSTSFEHPAVAALAIVSLPGLLLGGLALVVGSCLGAVVVGVRLLGRSDDSRSLVPAVVVGAVVLGASQLVPVLGALVAMGLATVAIGAVVRRRFAVDERLFDGADSSSDPTTASDVWDDDRATVDRRAGGRGPVDERRSSDGDADETASVRVSAGNGWEWDGDGGERRDRTGVSAGRSDVDAVGNRGIGETEDGDRTDDEWTVDHWEWETESDGGEDETRTESVDDGGEEGDRRTW